MLHALGAVLLHDQVIAVDLQDNGGHVPTGELGPDVLTLSKRHWQNLMAPPLRS